MRHRISQRKLNRTSSHRRAMQRNMAQSLFQHGEIRTTVPKAKDIRAFAERIITLAKRAAKGDLIARRQVHRLLGDRSFVAAEHQSTYDDMSDAKRHQVFRMRSGKRHVTGAPKGHLEFTAESITHRLLTDVAPTFEDRPGGYTRLIKLPNRRIGDSSELAIVQLVGKETEPGSVTKPGKSARKRRADSRYAAAIKAAKQFGKAGAAEAPVETAATDADLDAPASETESGAPQAESGESKKEGE